MATLLKMQKPIAVPAVAWWPGGLLIEKAWSERPSQTASTAASAAPADRSAAACEPGPQKVSPWNQPPPRCAIARTARAWAGVWTSSIAAPSASVGSRRGSEARSS